MDKFEREGLLQYDLQQITFTDKAALKYVHGGWLEEHVLSAVKDIKGLQDYALGGEIIKLGRPLQNKNKMEKRTTSWMLLF